MLKAATVALATLLLSGTAAPQNVSLDDAIQGLQTKYETVTDFKATFKQVVKRKHLPRPLKKQGTVYFKKPGMMRWDYAQPDRVYYVSDGEVLWSYQPTEKLVHKLRVKDSELYSALNFLFGQGDLKKEFNIALGGVKDDLVALTLTPKVSQSNYKTLTLHLDPETWEIRVTELIDPLDNVSTVTFIDPTYETLKVSGFKFTPPEGVRVEDLQAHRGGNTP
jgi:outer membrane lipoprotein carrier protein